MQALARDTDSGRVFSLYFLGRGKDWHEWRRTAPPLTKIVNSAVNWLMATIVFFGLLGRLKAPIQQYADLSWYLALERIAQSNLQTFGGVIGALIMTVALLLAIRFIVYFVHQIFRKITGGIDAAAFFGDFDVDEIVTRAVLDYYLVGAVAIAA